MSIRLIRRYAFSASHLYRRPDWSEEENREKFGMCANLPGHGHNYRLWVQVAGQPDPETGFIINLETLDEIVKEQVLSAVDHQHLNHALAEFSMGKAIPSSENLVLWARSRLEKALPEGVKLVALRLFEDESLGAEWVAG
ncbi:MAG TPA: 6-carboxytetrahydropterin synthase [Thermoanaerobaculia bacterium]|nr:6-carboxytetrahydropterin synthase [Thermoanaerobaculia bacterium]